MEKIELKLELEKLREQALFEIMQLTEKECEILLIMQHSESRGRAS